MPRTFFVVQCGKLQVGEAILNNITATNVYVQFTTAVPHFLTNTKKKIKVYS